MGPEQGDARCRRMATKRRAKRPSLMGGDLNRPHLKGTQLYKRGALGSVEGGGAVRVGCFKGLFLRKKGRESC